MAESIPPDIMADLGKAALLHQRAAADHEQCLAFNRLMSDLLNRLEEAGCTKTADRVMGILLDCNPKPGAQCDKASRVGERIKKL
jgi:hypothetical protein